MDLSEQSERMQSFYGLAHDPFSAIVDSMVFSSAGGRYETAETIRHLMTYSPQDSMLAGPIGIGKRMLALQVLKLLDESWRVAWVDVADIVSPQALEKELIGQLGLGLKAETDTASLLEKINSTVAQRYQDEESFLLVVQRADYAGPEVLQMLLALRDQSEAPESRIRQLWLVEDGNFLDEETDDAWYLHQMMPFNDDEAEQYIRDRMIASGFVEDLPIPAQDISRLNQLSNGMPLQLNDIVRDYLIASTFKTTVEKQTFPIPHLIAGLAAVALVVIAFLYQTSDPKSTGEASLTTVSDDQPMTSVEKRLTDAVARVEARQQQDETAGDQAETEKNTGQTTQSAAVNTQEDSDKTEADASKSVPPSAGMQSSLIARGGDQQYTLQLIGVRRQAPLVELAAAFDDTQNVDILETTYQSEPWFILIYGQFNSREQAQAALNTLPPEVEANEPWIRTFKSLRDSLN